MKQKLCAIGEALIDFIPEEKGRRLKDVVNFKRVAGGAPANVAGAVAKLGLPARFVTQLGADAFGDYIVECLESSGIDTSFILRTKEADTALAFVSLAADGNRDFQFYRRNCADLMLPASAIVKAMIEDCGILHFCSVSLVESPMKHAHEALIKLAKEAGTLISFDPNLRLSLWDDEQALKHTVWDFIPSADILKISDEELFFITGKETIEEALDDLFIGDVKVIIYTMGKDGARAYTRSSVSEAGGFSIEVRDTTGAGDSFIGAFLYCLLHDATADITTIPTKTMESYLRFANAYAAYTTTKEGALDAMADAQTFADFYASLSNF